MSVAATAIARQMENADAHESILDASSVESTNSVSDWLLNSLASEIPHIPETVREVSDNLNRVQPSILQILAQAR